MSYLTIVLFSAAITVVFVKGSIFNALRIHGPDLWSEFARCPLCVGVWVGGGVTWLASSRGLFSASFPLLFTVLALGALTGCAALLFVRVLDWFEAATVAHETAEAVNALRAKGLKAELDAEPVRDLQPRNGAGNYLEQWTGIALQDVDLATLKKAVEEKEKRG
jgi:hypothetical protein